MWSDDALLDGFEMLLAPLVRLPGRLGTERARTCNAFPFLASLGLVPLCLVRVARPRRPDALPVLLDKLLDCGL